jgi:hypothetical protein
MDPIQKRELKRQAWMRLAAQRRRAGLLRGRVVAISLICFVVLWGIVFAQMATGNDPVLSGQEKASTKHAVASTRREVEIEPVETEPEVEESIVEEPEFEEEEFVGPEPEPEFEEVEPLVTSQS